MTRKTLIITAVVLAVAAVLAWFVLRDRSGGPAFETVVAERGALTEEITANGTVNPVRVVNVGSQVSGTVEKLYVDFNDRVTPGQLLLELDPRLFEAALAQSTASLANAEAQAALARANARRAAELRAQDFISQQDLETTQASARSADAQVASARAAVQRDRANLDFSIIRAPVAGTVIARQIDIGQTVAAAFQTPELLTIAEDLTRMQIEALVAEADIARVQKGQAVRFTVDAYGQREFPATVSEVRLNPTTQQNVVTFTVVVDVPNPDGALLPGMTANARFLVQEHRDVLLVPNIALSWKPKDYVPPRGSAQRTAERGQPGTGATIFVVGADGQPEPRRIRLGASDNENSLVMAGALKPGETIITGAADPDNRAAADADEQRPARDGG